MFEVICIANAWHPSPACVGRPTPECGSSYIVTGVHQRSGGTYYTLEGFNPDSGFHSSNFATLPDEPAEVIEELVEATA